MSVLRKYIPRKTPVHAEDMNLIGAELQRLGNVTGPDVIVDSTGVHHRRPPPKRRTDITVKVTGAASGGGKYNGRVWINPTADVSASGDLAAADLGTDPGSDNALVLNRQEVGKSTHDLTTSPVTVQFFGGEIIHVNSDSKFVVAINGIDQEDCT